MAYNDNDGSKSNDNNLSNNKKKALTPTIGEAVKGAIETGKEVIMEGPTDAGDITGVNADDLLNTNEQEKINKEIVNGIVMSPDNEDDSKIAIDVTDHAKETSLIEDKIIISPESSGEITEASVATVTTIPTEEGIEVEVQTGVEVPVEDKDKGVDSELKLKVKSPTSSTEIPLTDEQTTNSPLPAESDLEKEKERTPDSLDNPLTQRQLSSNELYTEPTLDSAYKNMWIKMRDIPNYPNTDDESQKRVFPSTKDAFDDYVKFQNQTINSFQEAFIPIHDTTNNMFLTSQTFWRRVFEIYSNSSAVYSENTIALGKMINEIATANISAFKSLFSIPKGT
ncbi:MAG: hypothetical protein H0U27_03515 [Nitrosopumilus sp.]|nr:hypothetical protein [Nitrosopumilus sp.]